MRKLLFSALIGLFIFGNSGNLFARGGSFGGGGSRSFSSPSRSFSSPSRSFSSPSRSSSSPSPSSGSSGWWSKGSTTTPKPSESSPTPSSGSSWWNRGSSATAPSSSSGAPQTTINKGIGEAMSGQRSQEKFEAHQAAKAPRKPATDYFRSDNSSASQQRIHDLKSELNYQKMQNRDLREQQMYTRYYSAPAPMVYHDSFNPWFWMWLMDRNSDTRAETIYHHRDEMDPERYKDLLAKDAELEAKIKELEAKGVKQDPSFVPTELKDDKDLMYSNEAVKAAYDEEHSSNFPWFWTIAVVILLGGGYLFFIKQWDNL